MPCQPSRMPTFHRCCCRLGRRKLIKESMPSLTKYNCVSVTTSSTLSELLGLGRSVARDAWPAFSLGNILLVLVNK